MRRRLTEALRNLGRTTGGSTNQRGSSLRATKDL